MNILKFACLAVMASTVVLNFSCKKKSSDKEEKAGAPPEEIRKLFIPVKLESDDLVIDLKYLEHTALLTEITNSDGYKFEFTYIAQQPVKLDKYRNNKQFTAIYYQQSENKDLQVTAFDVNGIVFTPTSKYILEYNTQDQLIGIKNYANGSKMPFSESTLAYSSSGNVLDITTLDYAGHNSSLKYTHDEKNGIFKNVMHAQLLFLEMDYNFLFAALNNRLTYSNTGSPQENTTFNYQYNADDYPSHITVTENKSKQIFKISYVELKQ